MAESRQMVLPDGEFFRLIDRRDEFDVLTGRMIRPPGMEEGSCLFDQHDADPDQSRALSMARLQRLRDLDAARPRTRFAPSLFDDRRFPFDASLLNEASYFYGPAPRQMFHYDGLRDFACEPIINAEGTINPTTGTYDLVSNEWKSAIECLEPDVHEFFPHTMYFADACLEGFFIFRDACSIDFVDYGSGKISPQDVGARHGPVPKTTTLPVRRSLMAGKHWFQEWRSRQIFVSRSLALQLLPLLPLVNVAIKPNQPNLVRFERVELVDAGS